MPKESRGQAPLLSSHSSPCFQFSEFPYLQQDGVKPNDLSIIAEISSLVGTYTCGWFFILPKFLKFPKS